MLSHNVNFLNYSASDILDKFWRGAGGEVDFHMQRMAMLSGDFELNL